MLSELEAKLIRIIQEQLVEIRPCEEASLDDKLDELGLNSVSFIKMIVKIEEEFEFEFEEEDLGFQKFKTIKDICEYIESITSA